MSSRPRHEAVTHETDLRERIVQAALMLFQRKSYRATSLEDIIAAAECSIGGFYHHFSSKDDLLFLIHDRFITKALEQCQAIHDRDDTAARRLADVMVDIVQNVGAWKEHVTIFFEERRFMSTEKFAIVLEKRHAYDRLVEGIVADGLRSGEFKSRYPARIVALGIYGMVNWTYQWLRPDGALSPREIGELFADIALHGLMS